MIRNRKARALKRDAVKRRFRLFAMLARTPNTQPPLTHIKVAPAGHGSLPFRAGWQAQRATSLRNRA